MFRLYKNTVKYCSSITGYLNVQQWASRQIDPVSKQPQDNDIVHDAIVIDLLWLRCCHLMIIKTYYLYSFNV